MKTELGQQFVALCSAGITCAMFSWGIFLGILFCSLCGACCYVGYQWSMMKDITWRRSTFPIMWGVLFGSVVSLTFGLTAVELLHTEETHPMFTQFFLAMSFSFMGEPIARLVLEKFAPFITAIIARITR